jgi:hypothetical protein
MQPAKAKVKTADQLDQIGSWLLSPVKYSCRSKNVPGADVREPSCGPRLEQLPGGGE